VASSNKNYITTWGRLKGIAHTQRVDPQRSADDEQTEWHEEKPAFHNELQLGAAQSFGHVLPGVGGGLAWRRRFSTDGRNGVLHAAHIALALYQSGRRRIGRSAE